MAKKFKAIFCIVEKGKTETVCDAAFKAGAQAVTHLDGEGTGLRQKLTLRAKLIDPNKKVLIFLVEKTKVDAIFDAIKDAAALVSRGKGIAFVLDVDKIAGI